MILLPDTYVSHYLAGRFSFEAKVAQVHLKYPFVDQNTNLNYTTI